METYPLFAGDIDLRFVERVHPDDKDANIHGLPRLIRVLQWRRAGSNPYAHYGPYMNAPLSWGEWQDVRLEGLTRG